MRRLRQRARGQGGWVLATVIAMLGLIALIGTALFTMTVTALKVTETFRGSLDEVSVSDSALESVISDLQRDAGSPDCSGSGLNGIETVEFDGESTDVDYECAGSTTGNVRTMRIQARPDGATSWYARAELRITDVDNNGDARPGFRVEICDWQLGEHVDQDVALASATAGCPPS